MTPTVANGKVLVISVQGVLTCYDAANGDQLWQKDEFAGTVPVFFTASSPIVVDGMCIAQLGGGTEGRGAMVALDLNSGQEKWRANEGRAAYSSPVLMTVDGIKVVIAPSETHLVAVNTANGKVVWQIQYSQGRYNSATPIVSGQTLIVAGPGAGVGLTAWKLSKQGEELKEEQAWQYSENQLVFNTPVMKDGDLYGLSGRDQLFCVKLDGGQATTAWVAPIAAQAAVGQVMPTPAATVFALQQPERGRGEMGGQGRGEGGRGEGRRGEGRQGGRRGGRGGGGGRAGYGSVVDAGTALVALSPAADLVVFKPSDAEFTQIARYKVSEQGGTYAYPILSGNRIFIKDADSVALFTVE
jgi:outer membrane protein assembly factor BamB